ncbi:MAG: hypothetical protein KA383_01890 [Phycisphaerae bacterium]|nr:hypothetical protein [Phycisphaerae bacterium]
MKLPELNQSQRYRGLYLFDFGEWTAVGYTAEEVALLLEHEVYHHGKAYRIVRATPDGQMELKGVSPERFQLESGMFFNRDDLAAARQDFATLTHLAREQGAPCRAFVHLADRGPQVARYRYVTALIYPAEYDDDMAQWLLAAEYAGGDLAEGGVSHVSNYQAESKTILERQQLWSQPAIPSRSPEQVLSSVRQAVQR